MSLAWPSLHSYNEIGAKAACAIAGALGANETLCFLRFDGNRPGFAGQSALLCAVRDKQQPERDLRVSMIDCSAGDARLIRAIDATSSFWIDADATLIDFDSDVLMRAIAQAEAEGGGSIPGAPYLGKA